MTGFVIAGKHRYALVMTVAACAMSWARIFLGLHFPVDILGAILVSSAAALTVRLCLAPFLEICAGLVRLAGHLRRRLPFAGLS